MRAVRFVEGSVVVEDVPPPTGDGVLVNVRACGICGSDTTILDSGYPIAGIPGHEVAGELEDGTPVAIEPLEPCGACRDCLAGNHQVCPTAVASIVGIGRDGGMAEQVRVPPSSLVPLPRSLDVDVACLVEPVAVAVHGVRRAEIDGTTRVLVMGGGSIGLSAVAAARATQAEVDLVARHPAQRETGRRLGAQLVDSASGGDYDVVLDCAGTESAIAASCDALRPRGLLLMLATSWDTFTLPGLVMGAKELELRMASMYGRAGTLRDVDAAAGILAANEAIADALISDRFPLDRAPEAFARTRDRKGGAIKVVLEP